MSNKLVSVVIPCFNSGLTLYNTLCSVVNQTYNYWEVICVDDGSNDNTWDIICEFSEKYSQIHGIKRDCSEKGGSVCRNIGIEHAKGKYIIFLDGDDLLAPTCIEHRLNDIVENNSCFCVWPYAYLKNDAPGNNAIDYKVQNYLYSFASGHAAWQTTCPIYLTEFVREIGGFDSSFLRLQDIEFGLRAVFYSNGNFIIHKKNTPPDCYYRPNTEKTRISKYLLALNHYDKLAILVENLVKNGLQLSGIRKRLVYTCLNLTAYQVYIMCNDSTIRFNSVFHSFDIRKKYGIIGALIFFFVNKMIKSDKYKVFLCRCIKRMILNFL